MLRQSLPSRKWIWADDLSFAVGNLPCRLKIHPALFGRKRCRQYTGAMAQGAGSMVHIIFLSEKGIGLCYRKFQQTKRRLQ